MPPQYQMLPQSILRYQLTSTPKAACIYELVCRHKNKAWGRCTYKPGGAEEEVASITGDARLGWNHPDKRANDRKSGNDQGVNGTAERTDAIAVTLVDEICREAEDDSGEHKLRHTEDERHDAGDDHGEQDLIRGLFGDWWV
jgi:hypothetical protein